MWLHALLIAQALPLVRYRTGDGLSNDQVRCLHEDARGYLWIGTSDGVDRFDGRTFVRYGTESGLASPVATAVVERSPGELFFALHGSWLAHYVPERRPCFRSHQIPADAAGQRVFAITLDADGHPLLATEESLLRATIDAAGRATFTTLLRYRRATWTALARDDAGNVLFASPTELAWLPPGQPLRSQPRPTTRSTRVWQARAIARGRFLVLQDRQISEVVLAPTLAECALALPWIPERENLRAIVRDARGDIWIAGAGGLWRAPAGDLAAAHHAVPGVRLTTLYADRALNVWFGEHQLGLVRLSALPLRMWLEHEGKPMRDVAPWCADANGAIFASTSHGALAVRGRAIAPLPAVLAAGEFPVDAARDGAGGLWVASDRALCYVPGGDLSAALGADGVHRLDVVTSRLSTDRHGRVWCLDRDGTLLRLTPRPHGTPAQERLAAVERGSLLAVDGDGCAYVRGKDQFVRVRDGTAEPIHFADPRRFMPSWMAADAPGRTFLLTPTVRGLATFAGERAGHVALRWFGAAHGLQDGVLWSAAFDRDGKVWLAGSRGLDRFDPAAETTRHFPWPPGFGGGAWMRVCVGSDQRVWVGGAQGLAVFDPDHVPPPVLPRVFATTCAFGDAVPDLPDGGTTTVPDLEVVASHASLHMECCSPFLADGTVRFQHRLLPGQPAWSEPSESGVVRVAAVGPGSYTLEVRAITSDGTPSAEQVRLAMRVVAPLWQRAWFLATLGLLAALIAGLALRARVRRLLGLEAVRRQIATDLHDDLGSGLAQVAVLSEVMKRRRPGTDDQARLDEIAQLARSMGQSLADIVWAVDPTKDSLAALVHRVRHVANNLLAGDDVHVEFLVPDDAALATVRLPPDRRRHIFLVCKEALANCARHARAHRVTFELKLEQQHVVAAITDDGIGFDAAGPPAKNGPSGNGLDSMRRRASALGTQLLVQSQPGRGTRIELRAPL